MREAYRGRKLASTRRLACDVTTLRRLVPELTPPNTRPPPLLGPLAQPATQRAALHVPTNRPQVIVRLDQKRLESPLIHVPRADRMAMGVPALRMGQRKPADKSRKVGVLPRPRRGFARRHRNPSRCQRSAFERSPGSAHGIPTRPPSFSKVVPCPRFCQNPTPSSIMVPDTFSSSTGDRGHGRGWWQEGTC